jgi:sec-independent protein translocase protein TatA
MNLGAPELLIILLVVLLLFGGAKLPKLARSLGQAQKEFKSGMDDPDKAEPTKPKASGETVTMSKDDLEALIAEREAKARREAKPSD